jgi:predicted regulator of Ras-like GTPase activity (Roadblock/LC7/MglB family)
VIEIEIPQDDAVAPDEPPAFQLVPDPAPAWEVAPESATETEPTLEAEPAVEMAPPVEILPVAEAAQEPISAPEEIQLAPDPEPAVAEAMQHPPAPVEEGTSASAGKTPGGIGSIFGEPNREHWTPADIVARLPQLPGIAGGVVALQEGLLVAHSLPEDVKGEVVAAFLPQVFARLNQYAGEMKLGEVDDLLFTTRGAHCQIYRLGFVYFAVLGKPGESLPWHELRFIAEELAKQTQPS